VELDGDVVTIAEKWFDCPIGDPRLSVVVGDGVEFLADAVKGSILRHRSLVIRGARLNCSGDRYDVVFVDVAGAMHDDGLSCPPASFITDDCLRHMHDALTPTGQSRHFNRFVFPMILAQIVFAGEIAFIIDVRSGIGGLAASSF
jgi:hypothetical protein